MKGARRGVGKVDFKKADSSQTDNGRFFKTILGQ
jgi:hypothetical protein